MSYPQGPQQGGYPQQPQQPQPGPYGPPGGYPQYGGYPPPRKPKTGLIVGIVAAVVVLATLGITGFVAPGFFLGDDDSGSSGTNTSTAQGAAQSMVAAINTKNAAGVRGLKCANAEEELEQVAAGLDRIRGATLGQLQEAGQTATVTLQVDLGVAEKFNTTGQLANENGKWCWRAFDDSSASASPTSAPGALPTDVDMSGADPFLRGFLSDVNSGDESAAIAKLCQDDARSGVEMAVEKGANVTLGAMEADSERSMPPNASARWDVTGNLTGKVIASTEDNGATWCVQTFSVF